MARTFAQLPGYEVVNRIGKGAAAIIYSARKRDTRELVAIKHVVRHGPDDDRFLEQAENEYEVARRFQHPYLRKCLDIQRTRRWLKTNELFLVLEFIDGERVEDIYREHRPSDFIAVCELFIKVSEGLHELHRLGYAHADMKHNNIMVTRQGSVKIIDFGQSCPLGHVKERIQGTPDFIAPEQVLRREIDQRTDIYNLGATMYWVATGKAFATVLPPSAAGALKMQIESRRANDSPSDLDPLVPVPLSKLIMECCENDRDSRPRDMAAVMSRLETIIMLARQRRHGDPAAPV